LGYLQHFYFFAASSGQCLDSDSSFHALLRLLQQPFPSWCAVISIPQGRLTNQSDMGWLLALLVGDYARNRRGAGNDTGNFLPISTDDDLANNLQDRILGVWMTSVVASRQPELMLALLGANGWNPAADPFIQHMMSMIASHGGNETLHSSLAIQWMAFRNVAYLVAVRHQSCLSPTITHLSRGTIHSSPTSDQIRLVVPVPSSFNTSEMEYSPESVAPEAFVSTGASETALVAATILQAVSICWYHLNSRTRHPGRYTLETFCGDSSWRCRVPMAVTTICV
jgi:hypothetical protein